MRSALCPALLLSAVSFAAAPTSVDEIVARHVEARGGLKALDAIHSVRITGRQIYAGGSFSMVMPWGEVEKAPGMIRDETTLQGMTQVDAYDGKEGWTTQPFGGRKEPQRTSAEEAKLRSEDADMIGPLVHWKEKGHQVEYLGTEDVDSTPALKLRVTLKTGDFTYVFLDPDSYLEIRWQTHRFIRGVEQIGETDFGSYQQVGGVWFPFEIDSGAVARPKEAHNAIDRLEVNVEVDSALFKFPVNATSVPQAISPGPAGPAPVTTPPTHAAAVAPPRITSGVVSGLGARNIGSAAMSGRISAVAARVENGKTTVFVGSASGGVWKSTDDATTFKPVFDKQPVQSIGAVALDPTDPKTVWVGSGEGWTRNSVSIGDGIYKSTDGGDTWKNMGLPDSERIARILVHPKNGAVVYACVPGKLWSDSKDRGVYKTSDSGKSWSLVLTGKNLSTGCSGLSMDPKNPDVLFAGLWDFRRKGWTFRSGGEGPDKSSGSGLFRTADGGKSWQELEPGAVKGLPKKPWGRIEVAVAPSDPNVVYALIESTRSALFRSDDGGKTWEQGDRSTAVVWRPFYFARLVVDPTNAKRLFKPDGTLVVSEDSGRSFAYSAGGSHGDWHDLWIDPGNPKHVIGGDDGGLWLSFDGGSRWWKVNNLPVSQFYHVAVDDKDPYQVYGGLQDNSSWVGDSSYPGGVTNQRWENMYGGDGFWTFQDPSDPRAVYAEAQGGNIGRVDRNLHTIRDIQPRAGFHEKLRFNWNTPIATSPTDKNTLYLGAQFLFRSKDKGENWQRISPDLSTNDPEKQKQEESGGVTVDNSSAEMHTTVYSISESPKDAKVIWVGTDDGNLQLTRDSGKSWTNLVSNVPGLPPNSWVSWVEASRFDKATAYAAFDRHTYGDMTPWVFRTRDFGKTWTRLVGPESGVRGYVHVVREDTVKATLLFVGSEFGLWISPDDGNSWAEFKGADFPSVAVRDLQVQPRDGDLVLATHGRGIWIIDDLTPLRALTADVMAKDAAFLPGRPIQQRMPARAGWVEGDATYVGSAAPNGAVISYYQRTRHVYGPLKLEILDPAGQVVETLPASESAGINRVTWSMRVKPPVVPRAAQLANSSTQGPRVVPARYKARLTRGTDVVEAPLDLTVDRRAPYGVADRKANFDASMRVHALFGEMSGLMARIEGAGHVLAEDQKAAPANGELAKSLDALAGHLEALRKKVVATKEGGDITGEERIREHADDIYNAFLTWEGKPPAYQLERIDVLKRELVEVEKDFDALASREVAPLNPSLEKAKLPPIPTAPLPAPSGGPATELVRPCLQRDWAACEQALEGQSLAATERR